MADDGERGAGAGSGTGADFSAAAEKGAESNAGVGVVGEERAIARGVVSAWEERGS
ncbi:MAG: hypothetical protein QXP73_03875 [Candidatus Methanomethylicaceae archaeon]|nr:hypothetical protein [Candidatus Verstraetearchaeota archaeon]